MSDAVATIRVVLADDHDVVRAGLRALLSAQPDFEVVGEARDGGEACRMAIELQPDVVVMDVTMPVMGGIEATERLRREIPTVRVVVLTVHEDRAYLHRLLSAGAAGYVLKRAGADELFQAIRAVAAGRTYLDSGMTKLMVRPYAPSSARAATATESLSEREEEVLRLLARGHSNKEAATSLGISVKTVETYRTRMREKLGLRTRMDMVQFAIDQGWLHDE